MNNPVAGLLNMFMSQVGDNMTPFQRSCIDVLKSGDAAKGEAFANSILQNRGVTKEQAVPQAEQFFNNFQM